MSRSEHIPWPEILDQVERRAPLLPQRRQHLEQCQRCQALHRDAENLLGTLEIASSTGLSPDLTRSAWLKVREELREQRALRRTGRAVETARGICRAVEGWKEIWATLASGFVAPSHAVRGAGTDAPQVQLYEAGDYMVSLSLKPEDHATQSVLGKVVPRSAAEVPPGVVALWVDEEERRTDLGPHGAFRFDRIRKGPIRLDVRIGDVIIHLRPVDEAGRPS